MDWLSGAPAHSTEQLRAQVEEVTPDHIREAAAECRAHALVRIPEGDLGWAGFVRAPEWAPSPLTGRRYPSRDDRELTLVHSQDALALEFPGGEQSVVRFREVKAALFHPDGGRALIGADGARVQVEPALFGLDPTAVADIDRSVPDAAMVHLPPRDPDDIPQPEEPEPRKRRGWFRRNS